LIRYQRLGLFAKIAFWIVVLSPVVAVVGYKVAKPVYRNWKQANALRMAEKYAEEGDIAAATMLFRKALRTNHRNPDAWRRVARFLDAQGAPDSVEMWQEVVRRDGNDLEARFQLIEAALRHHRKGVAREALNALPEQARDGARYFFAKGSLAADEGDFPLAIQDFDKAFEIDPNLEGLAIRRNIVRLRGGDDAQRLEAKEALEALGKSEEATGAQAFRELFADAVSRGDAVSARVYANNLLEHPKVSLRDQFVLGDFELGNGGLFFSVVLDRLREEGERDPDKIGAITNYLLARGRMAEAEVWLNRFPDEQARLPQVQAARFEIALAKGSLTDALDSLDSGDAALPPEVLKNVKEAFDLLDTSRSEALAAWGRAVTAGKENPAVMLALVKLSKARGWEDAQLKTLWTFVEQRPKVAELWHELVRLETGRRNLHGVHEAVQGALRANPENLALQSNFVIVSYLLGKGEPSELLAMAERAYAAAPRNPFFITSYAVALMNAGQTDRAVEIIDQLSPADQAIPERALYRGAVYAAAAKPEVARASLALAEPALNRMLPEEGLLHRSVLARLDGRTLSNEDVLTALKSSGASAEEKEQLAKALREGRTQRSEDADRLAAELRERRPAANPEDSADVLEQLREQRADRNRTHEEMRALVDEIRKTPSQSEETD